MTTSLDEALIAARERYTRENPASAICYARARSSLAGGNTRSTLFWAPFPLTMKSASAQSLIDVDEHSYVNMLGEYSAGIYGHTNPSIRRAIEAALDNGMSMGANNLLQIELAEAVCDRFGLERVRFTNSGTESNLLVMQMARAITKRDKVMVFRGAYHGGVFMFGAPNAPMNLQSDIIVAPFDDIDAFRSLLSAHAGELACVLIEPMLGSAGCLPASHAFIAALREAADQTGAILIFDEVQTSRLGASGLQKHYGVTPDLKTLGKYLGGGSSFGAFGGRADLMDWFDPEREGALVHAGTFNNNVISMAAGLAGLTKVYTSDAAIALTQRGERLREDLNACARYCGAALHFTGIGSLMQGHFAKKAPLRVEDLKHDNPALAELFFFEMLAAGFYLAKRGTIALSLSIEDRDCRNFIKAVEDFCLRYREFLRSD
jgi:glutamate-1-semialdehyde 2,1-aminomutase